VSERDDELGWKGKGAYREENVKLRGRDEAIREALL